MSVWRLVIKEIRYRKLDFALAVAAVLVAVGCLVAAVTILRGHDLRTEQILAAKIAAVEAEVGRREQAADQRAAELNETFRVIMLKFGYNLLILPKEVKLIDYELRGGSSATMDEKNVTALAESRIMTVRHLLPVLQARGVLGFGDKRQEVFLIGTRGEVPFSHRLPKRPLQPAVGAGQMIVGSNIHTELGVNVGDEVTLADRVFAVMQVVEARGTADDSTVWIDLKAAQELLGKPGRITGIFALSCVCSGAELDQIKKDIVRILPEAQVRSKDSDATIRYESRHSAALAAEAQLQQARRRGAADIEQERLTRAELRNQLEALAGWMLPLLVVGAAIWTGLGALVNVRHRRREIGVLRALGVGSGRIFGVFLTRAVLVGAVGAVAGYVIGFAAACAWPAAPPAGEVFNPWLLAAVLPLAPLLSAAAGWVPAMLAARQDPATVLREE